MHHQALNFYLGTQQYLPFPDPNPQWSTAACNVITSLVFLDRPLTNHISSVLMQNLQLAGASSRHGTAISWVKTEWKLVKPCHTIHIYINHIKPGYFTHELPSKEIITAKLAKMCCSNCPLSTCPKNIQTSNTGSIAIAKIVSLRSTFAGKNMATLTARFAKSPFPKKTLTFSSAFWVFSF